MRLVVFDVDGTIVDSAHIIVDAALYAFGQEKLNLPTPEDVRHGIGLKLETAIEHLLDAPDDVLVERLAGHYRDYFFGAVTDEPHIEHIYDGAYDAIHRLGAHETTLLGIATGKHLRGVHRLFDNHDFGHHFVTLQAADNNPSKPHPGMLHNAINETGVEADRTVMVGDTRFDMQMAKAANVKAIGVAWGYHDKADLLEHGADIVIDKYEHIDDAIDGLIG